jgi:nucleotide-binding universal stress UspA family protein
MIDWTESPSGPKNGVRHEGNQPIRRNETMQPIRNVLLVHDPREAAIGGLWRAAGLARRHRARLTVLEVVPKVPYEADVTVAGVDLSKAVLKERRRQLDHQLEPIREDGIEVVADVRPGRTEEVLAAKVQELGSGLLVVGSADRPAPVAGLRRRIAQKIERLIAESTPAAA